MFEDPATGVLSCTLPNQSTVLASWKGGALLCPVYLAGPDPFLQRLAKIPRLFTNTKHGVFLQIQDVPKTCWKAIASPFLCFGKLLHFLPFENVHKKRTTDIRKGDLFFTSVKSIMYEAF